MYGSRTSWCRYSVHQIDLQPSTLLCRFHYYLSPLSQTLQSHITLTHSFLNIFIFRTISCQTLTAMVDWVKNKHSGDVKLQWGWVCWLLKHLHSQTLQSAQPRQEPSCRATVLQSFCPSSLCSPFFSINSSDQLADSRATEAQREEGLPVLRPEWLLILFKSSLHVGWFQMASGSVLRNNLHDTVLTGRFSLGLCHIHVIRGAW